MPFDPGADTAAPTSLGTLTDPQLAATFGLDQKTAALPVLLKRATPLSPAAAADFSVRRGGLAGAGSAPPTTAGGDKVIRYDQALGSLGTLSSSEIEDLQRRLFAGGFYSKAYYTKRTSGVDLGNPNDPGTVTAFRQALNAAVRSQDPLNDVINAAAASRSKGGFPTDLGSGGPRVSVTLTNPADLTSVAHTAAGKVYGRQASQREIAGFTSAFHQQEIAAQTAAQDPTNASLTQAPNASAFAEQYLRQSNPQATMTQNYADALSSLMSAMGAGGKAAG